jgi:hypothetical protein
MADQTAARISSGGVSVPDEPLSQDGMELVILGLARFRKFHCDPSTEGDLIRKINDVVIDIRVKRERRTSSEKG